jgi:hypothetical protein
MISCVMHSSKTLATDGSGITTRGTRRIGAWHKENRRDESDASRLHNKAEDEALY